MGTSTRKPISVAEIRRLAGPEVFARGDEYRRRDAVSDLVMRGDTLTAAVAGSEIDPYRVSIRIARGKATAFSCTCPYEWGGACKHVVAALLTLADDPGSAVARPTLDALLSPLSAEALRDLILRRAEEDPDLNGWIEADLATALRPGGAPVDTTAVSARARAVLSGPSRHRDFWDGYRPSGNADALRHLADKAVPHMEAGDGRSALRILEAVAEPVIEDWLGGGYETDEEFYLLFHDLGRMMAEAALLSDLDGGEREALVDTLEGWDAELYDYGVEDGFGIAARALEQGWDDPALNAILEGGTGPWPADDEDLTELELTAIRLRVLDARGHGDAYLNLARAVGAEARVATMLVRLGRIAEAVAHGSARFTLPDEALDLARALMEAGRSDEAFHVAEAGLGLAGGRCRRQGRRTVASRRLGPPPGPLAARGRRRGRAHGPRHPRRPRGLPALAVAGEGWDRLKPDLLAGLIAAESAPDRIEILLDEGMIDEAVAAIGEATGYDTPEPVTLRLLEAAPGRHSDWVIRTAERKAVAIIDQGQAGRYDVAAAFLACAARAYDAAGRIDDWTVRIEDLIATHRRKHKLSPLLAALRYDA
ncbi:SWIM zinc finger family protein [Methylobacterium bullatum]|uniref:SWIM-type domain-containing protein n=1 Tax=Methylobacterium bullatum TaxID=570505 RepID=A0A679K2T3_9HYPH|nr:hypothetical protein MBLL_01517 [Methylobacterium bullatum]